VGRSNYGEINSPFSRLICAQGPSNHATSLEASFHRRVGWGISRRYETSKDLTMALLFLGLYVPYKYYTA
jgi:hypothetical protein